MPGPSSVASAPRHEQQWATTGRLRDSRSFVIEEEEKSEAERDAG